MKQILFLFFSIPIFYSAFSQNCSHLKNGIYELVYDNNSYRTFPKAQYEISDSTCYITQHGLKNEYEIKAPYECRFWLVSKEVIDTAKLTESDKILLQKQPFYDIYKVEDDTYYFILRFDLHHRMFSGKFVKIKN